MNRLKTVNYGDGQTQSYAFDAMGNRSSLSNTTGGTTTTEGYTFDNVNRLLTRAGNTYTNDVNGNTLTGGGRTNAWDSQNRLVQCVNGANTVTYKYGSNGLRRQMTQGTNVTDFILDGQSVVAERKNGSVSATYLTGAQGPLYRKDAATGQVRWYLYDGLGSVQGEVDGSGTVTASRKFDVYGLVRGSTGTSTSRHKFVGGLGHTSEDETGLIYMRARYYDPQVGRFTSEDPAFSGLNWFIYCDNNPINKTDSTGKFADVFGGSTFAMNAEVDHDLKVAVIAGGALAGLAVVLAGYQAMQSLALQGTFAVGPLSHSPGQIGSAWGISAREALRGIERLKQQSGWRSNGNNRNPDVVIDLTTGEAYPLQPDGTVHEDTDSIGNLRDILGLDD